MEHVHVYPDAQELAAAAAELFVTLAEDAVQARGRFAVALAGGSTPRGTYALLASSTFASRVDWARVHLFWGDERCVPPEHPESNYRMARETLLDHVSIPTTNVHRIPCEREPAQAAAAYERTLRAFFASTPTAGVPRFDLILLGMGDDGHTASLFPGTTALREQRRWVVAHYVEQVRAWRVTLTPVVLNAALHVAFLVAGAGKAARLQQVLRSPYQPDVLPAQIVQPTSGRLVWLVDAAAAAHL